jgi:hypothetical protein
MSLQLSAQTRERLLRDMWIAHDSRWFIKTSQEIGIEAANKLNIMVLNSIGKTEIKKLLHETKHGKITSIEDLKNVFEQAAELYLPVEHKYRFSIIDNNTIRGEVIECFIYNHLKQANTVAFYQCAGKARCDAWMEACGVDGKSSGDCIAQECNGRCTITYEINPTATVGLRL